MQNILVVFTGGTIGSTVHAGTIDTSDAARYQLLHLFQQHDAHPEDLHFHCIQPLQLLSENLAPPAWQTLINAIEAETVENYDGIIITHGTDTLAYTACALSFYFHALTIPLLLVSSDYPLDDDRANGVSNFGCAVEFIRQHQPAGVFAPYRNSQQTMQVHQGTHLTCSLQLSSDFFSVRNKAFMQFENGHFTVCNPIQKTAHTLTTPLKAQFSSRVLMIKPYPSLDYSNFDLQSVDAVLHDLYHSCTACATTQWGEQHSLVAFIERCNAENIRVYLAPAIHSENAYQSTRELIEHGAIMLWNLSIEAAFVKLLLAYGNFNNVPHIIDFMNMTVADEHS
ncbi:MAG: asparaginase [Methylococcales bacterium]|nr:asparaginase [Methylococcales bacterium]